MEFTKYEIARLIGARALQLACGAPPLIKIKDKELSFIDVAQDELDKKVIPLSVFREE